MMVEFERFSVLESYEIRLRDSRDSAVTSEGHDTIAHKSKDYKALQVSKYR